MITLAVGIISVLGMIIGLKLNAFLALVISALIVSLMSGGDAGSRIEAAAAAFGSAAGGIGIVIAMDAINERLRIRCRRILVGAAATSHSAVLPTGRARN